MYIYMNILVHPHIYKHHCCENSGENRSELRLLAGLCKKRAFEALFKLSRAETSLQFFIYSVPHTEMQKLIIMLIIVTEGRAGRTCSRTSPHRKCRASVCSDLRIISQNLKKTTKFLMTQKPEAFILADRKQHL